jgi:hypothetical protein
LQLELKIDAVVYIRLLLLFVTALSLCAHEAHADKRIALGIGNSAYQKVAPLSNPANDANAVATSLPVLAHRVIPLRCGIWLLPSHSGHWPTPIKFHL